MDDLAFGRSPDGSLKAPNQPLAISRIVSRNPSGSHDFDLNDIADWIDDNVHLLAFMLFRALYG